LQQGIGVVVVDVVPERRANLHADLLDLLGVTEPVPGRAEAELYGVAYRAVARAPAQDQSLEMWVERLALGSPLPALPLWIGPDLCVPVDLEAAYSAACSARRIG
jgi:hypothetical protein